MKVQALDHKNNEARARIEKWQRKVRRWYSISSNTIQDAVAAPNTPPDTFLFLHRKISAATCKQ